MKKLFIILTVFMSTLLMCDELAWVNEQVEAIKPPRSGMQTNALSKIHDPFIFLQRDELAKTAKHPVRTTLSNRTTTSSSPKRVQRNKQALRLTLIMNNAAMINNTWYKKGDSVNGYKITELHSKSVLLRKHNKQLLLSTKSINKNLKFNNR